jgi:glyoxylase-like metal-dependent hydrolase (beta-lactamase superfamily II)
VIDDWEDETLPVNAYLVRHPRINVLFDTGQTAEASHRDYFPAWHPWLRLARFELEPADEAAAQLERFGVPPDTIGYVVLSHLHTDHAGGIGGFTGAETIVSEIEWRRARGIGGRARGYLPGRWPERVRVRTLEPAGDPVGPFAASHDLLGDGALTIVSAPGHTPGHLAMLVRGPERAWLLAGDLAHGRDELERARPEVARWCADENVDILTAHDEPVPVPNG